MINLKEIHRLAVAVRDVECGSAEWDKATEALNDVFDATGIVEIVELLEAAERALDEAVKHKNESGERFHKAVKYGAKLDAELARRDAAAGEPAELEVCWGAPKTVGQLISQLRTFNPETETTAVLRMGKDFRDGKKIRQVPLSISWERFEGTWLADYKGTGRKVLTFWGKPHFNDGPGDELTMHYDAAVGEPVAYTSDSFMAELKESHSVRAWLLDDANDPGMQVKLYTAAQPAVVPPEMKPEPEKYDVIDHGFIAGYNQCRADALSLGAQPSVTHEILNNLESKAVQLDAEAAGSDSFNTDNRKRYAAAMFRGFAKDIFSMSAQPERVVVLPGLFDLKMAGDVKTKQYFKGSNDTIKQIAGLLDAAGVKWVAK